MKKFNYDLMLSGQDGVKQTRIPPGHTFISVINPTEYLIEIYQDARTFGESNVKQMLALCPVNTQITIPIDKGQDFTFIYRNTKGTNDSKKASVIFSDANLQISGMLGSEGSSGSVTIVGDSVGLAKANQLPTKLTAAGNLAVEVLNKPTVKVDDSTPLKVEMSAPVNIGSMDVNKINSEVQVVPGSKPLQTVSTSKKMDGFTLSATETATALPSQACVEVIIQADPDNTANIRVGGATGQGFKLLPGAALSFPVENCNQVYVRSDQGSQTVHGVWRG